jgi:transcriptional regulator with XRE-family HTH domain
MTRLTLTLRGHRTARGVTRHATAVVANVPARVLTLIEQGERVPTLAQAIALADTWGIGLDELIGRTVPPPRSFAGTGKLTGESARRIA